VLSTKYPAQGDEEHLLGGVVNLIYDSLSSQLHQRFPHLGENKYTDLVGNIDVDAEPYVLFGVIFNHYLIELANGNDYQKKKGVGIFLEEMAASSDSHVTFLLGSELLPTLVKEQATIDSFWSSLGPLTQRRVQLLPPRFLSKINLPSSA
jgi:hypothetical protein